MKKVWKFLRDEEGATAVEYGIMVALIAAVVIVGATALGLAVNGTFSNVAGVMPPG
jgi:pilus assembly protein Flp/PilA